MRGVVMKKAYGIVVYESISDEAFCESDEYQLALEALGDGVVRSYKICEAF